MAINGKSNWREPAYLRESVHDVQQVFLQSPLLKTFARVRNIELAVNRIVVLIDKLGFLLVLLLCSSCCHLRCITLKRAPLKLLQIIFD